jgi:hypothetical protein
MRPRTVLLVTMACALVVFCGVQDRVTAAGARQYVLLQRAAWSGGGAPVTIEGVVGPAVRRSVREAGLWSGVVLAAGFAAAAALAWRERRS